MISRHTYIHTYIDTHHIPADLGGNGNTIKVVHCNGEVKDEGESVLNCLEKRSIISSVGPDRVKTLQYVYPSKKSPLLA